MTKNQKAVLKLIAESEYHDGENPVDNPTWTGVIMSYYNGGEKEFLGVLVSLQNQGYVGTTPKIGRDDGTCWITEAGMRALK